MCYALSFIFLFTIGGLTGLWLGALSVDRHLHDTYFVVAHFHYVMVGGTLVGFLGGIFHWWPKMTGKMFNDFWGIVSCWFVFVGFNLTFLPQFVMGSRGMPRRYARYLPELLGLGLFVALGVLSHSMRRGKKAPPNPWGGATLEWHCSSPPPYYNFQTSPTVNDPYDYTPLVYRDAERGWDYVQPESAPKHAPHS
jgi:cytochrome c oxidase subunit 1